MSLFTVKSTTESGKCKKRSKEARKLGKNLARVHLFVNYLFIHSFILFYFGAGGGGGK